MFENFEKIEKALETNNFDVVVELNDRLLVRVPLTKLTVLNSLKGVRAGDPNRELLTKSIERTEQPIYPIACFGDFDDGEFSLAVVDGHQRKAVLESQGVTETIVQVFLWSTVEEAQRFAVEAGFSVNKLGDKDIVSVFATDTKISIAELEEATGIRDRKLRRLKLVASKEWSCELFAADAVNYSNLATLIEKAGDDTRRQNALEETFKVKKERADAYVNLWKNKIAENPNLARKHGKKTKLSEQFKKENWKLWELSLENESYKDGKLDLDTKTERKATAVIGAADDWTDEVAVWDFFGKSHKDLIEDDYELILAAFPEIKAHLERQLAKLRDAAKSPITSNPVEPITGTLSATSQVPDDHFEDDDED